MYLENSRGLSKFPRGVISVSEIHRELNLDSGNCGSVKRISSDAYGSRHM